MSEAVFITVRTGSTRLPNKSLLEINGKHTIEYVIENAKKTGKKVVLCTTMEEEDDVLCELALKHEICLTRGSTEDKLERWLKATEQHGVDFFVTADGDDLFCSPELMNLAFKQYEKTNCDFIEAPEKLIVGAFTYGIKTEALKKVCFIKDTNQTEMMWVYFTDTGMFNCQKLKRVQKKYLRPEIRATLDYEEDFYFFKVLIESIGKELNLKNIVEYIDNNPKILNYNSHLREMWKKNQEKKTFLRIRE